MTTTTVNNFLFDANSFVCHLRRCNLIKLAGTRCIWVFFPGGLCVHPGLRCSETTSLEPKPSACQLAHGGAVVAESRCRHRAGAPVTTSDTITAQQLERRKSPNGVHGVNVAALTNTASSLLLWRHEQQITDEGLITICRGCHRLQSLCVSGCANITDAILHALGQNCPRLR